MNPETSKLFIKFRQLLQHTEINADFVHLVDCLDKVSRVNYETTEIQGQIMFLPNRKSQGNKIVRLAHPVHLNTIRAVRKLVQISGGSLQLYCDGSVIYGFGVRSLIRKGLRVIFEQRGRWKVIYNHQLIFSSSKKLTSGKPAFFDKRKFASELKEVFTLSQLDLERLTKLIAAASKQPRGTNLLITDKASEEAQRLASQSTVLEPFQLKATTVKDITGIDGTVIMNSKGQCFAIGAILDGKVSPDGSRARGGRYNSAVMYCESAEHPCIIVIVSQDGGVDWVSSVRRKSITTK